MKTSVGKNRSRAGYKAARTRKVNALQREYNSTVSTGKRAAIKRKINLVLSEKLPV